MLIISFRVQPQLQQLHVLYSPLVSPMHKEMMRIANGYQVWSNPPYALYKDMNLFFPKTAGLTEGLSGMTQYQVQDFHLIHRS